MSQSEPESGSTDTHQSKTEDLLPLELDNLTYGVNNKLLLDGLDLTLGSPGITIVLGPNGAGKSLLLKCLHGLLQPAAGSITWNRQSTTKTILARQAMVFQTPVLLRRSVAANVDFAMNAQGKADSCIRNDLLSRVDLLDRKQQPARLLSGGEQQRLALARALSTGPDVLFLDEPTANLDPGSTQVIETIIDREKSSGTKVIFVTHDIGQAKRLADDVVFLHRGKVVEHAGATEFFEKPGSEEARAYLDGRILL